MPVNRFKLRNFDGHHFGGYQFPQNEPDFVFSNTLYDMNKGVTHDFFHTNRGSDDDLVRIVCDVEIACSSDPALTCMYSQQHRDALRNALSNQPRSPIRPVSVSDDVLADKCVDLNSFERSELFDYIRDRADILEKHISSMASSSSTPEPESVASPSSDVSSSNDS